MQQACRAYHATPHYTTAHHTPTHCHPRACTYKKNHTNYHNITPTHFSFQIIARHDDSGFWWHDHASTDVCPVEGEGEGWDRCKEWAAAAAVSHRCDLNETLQQYAYHTASRLTRWMLPTLTWPGRCADKQADRSISSAMTPCPVLPCPTFSYPVTTRPYPSYSATLQPSLIPLLFFLLSFLFLFFPILSFSLLSSSLLIHLSLFMYGQPT